MKKRGLLTGGWAVIVPLTAAMVLYLALVFFPQMSEIRALREQIASQQSFVSAVVGRGPLEKALDDEIAETRDYLRRYAGAAAKPAAVSAVFAGLAELLKSAAVQTTMFRPEPKQSLGVVERIPLTIGFTGTYDRLPAVLASIEGLNQRIWIEEVTLERGNETREMSFEIKPAIFADNFEISD